MHALKFNVIGVVKKKEEKVLGCIYGESFIWDSNPGPTCIVSKQLYRPLC